jgi:hypothetical protein
MNEKTKLKNESKLGGLAPEKRALVDQWLFTEGLTYAQVVELCAKEFGLEVSIAGVGRYYQEEGRRRAKEQMEKTPVCGGGAATWRLGMQADSEYRELLAITGRQALAAVHAAGRKMGMGRVTEILRLQISARREANQAQLVALAREKLEFDAATACLLHQKELQTITVDSELDEGDRVRAIREELFGPNLPE